MQDVKILEGSTKFWTCASEALTLLLGDDPKIKGKGLRRPENILTITSKPLL